MSHLSLSLARLGERAQMGFFGLLPTSLRVSKSLKRRPPHQNPRCLQVLKESFPLTSSQHVSAALSSMFTEEFNSTNCNLARKQGKVCISVLRIRPIAHTEMGFIQPLCVLIAQPTAAYFLVTAGKLIKGRGNPLNSLPA